VAYAVPLFAFMEEHAFGDADAFLDLFEGGFLLIRHDGGEAKVLFLPEFAHFKLSVGSDRECALRYPGLEPEHLQLSYHQGFKSFVVEVPRADSEIPVQINEQVPDPSRVNLLEDKSVIRLGAEGEWVGQFFLAEAFWNQILLKFRGSKPRTTSVFRRISELED